MTPFLAALTENDFDVSLRPIFRAFAQVWKENNRLSFPALQRTLAKEMGGDTEAATALLQPVIDGKLSLPSPGLVYDLIKEIKDRSLRNNARQLGKELISQADAGAPLTAIANSIFRGIQKFSTYDSQETSSAASLRQQLQTEFSFIAERPDTLRGLSWGYPELDRLTNGLVPGEVSVVAARPSVGKTTLALNVPLISHHKTLFFSLEMSAVQLGRRLADAAFGMNIEKNIRGGKTFPGADHPLWRTWGDWDFYVDAETAPTPDHLYFQTAAFVSSYQIQLVVLDYLQLVQVNKVGVTTRDREIAIISGLMKKIARDFNVAVILLSQLNRRSEASEQPRPLRLSDLRDSGAVEQDADIVLFLERETSRQNPTEPEGLKVTVGKNRNGPLGTISLKYNRETSKIY